MLAIRGSFLKSKYKIITNFSAVFDQQSSCQNQLLNYFQYDTDKAKTTKSNASLKEDFIDFNSTQFTQSSNIPPYIQNIIFITDYLRYCPFTSHLRN